MRGRLTDLLTGVLALEDGRQTDTISL